MGDHVVDDLAKALTDATGSRKQMLKVVGGVILAAVVPSLDRPLGAAGTRAQKRCRRKPEGQPLLHRGLLSTRVLRPGGFLHDLRREMRSGGEQLRSACRLWILLWRVSDLPHVHPHLREKAKRDVVWRAGLGPLLSRRALLP